MHLVTYSMGMSLDGYVVGPDGTFAWTLPEPDVFQYHLQGLRETAVQLMGRRLYETMLYWETAEEEQDLDDAEREWAQRWKALPKIVFSRTLTEVEGTNTTLATRSLTEEIEAWRAQPGDGDIALGGAGLAHAADDEIDEYRPLLHPVLVGGGTPYFPHDGSHVRLEALPPRTFAGPIVALRYRRRR